MAYLRLLHLAAFVVAGWKSGAASHGRRIGGEQLAAAPVVMTRRSMMLLTAPPTSTVRQPKGSATQSISAPSRWGRGEMGPVEVVACVRRPSSPGLAAATSFLGRERNVVNFPSSPSAQGRFLEVRCSFDVRINVPVDERRSFVMIVEEKQQGKHQFTFAHDAAAAADGSPCSSLRCRRMQPLRAFMSQGHGVITCAAGPVGGRNASTHSLNKISLHGAGDDRHFADESPYTPLRFRALLLVCLVCGSVIGGWQTWSFGEDLTMQRRSALTSADSNAVIRRHFVIERMSSLSLYVV